MKLINVTKENKIYYGGSQNWFKSKQKQRVGCGIIACANTLAHLIPDFYENNTIDIDTYLDFSERLGRYFPIIPYVGINGLSLAIGMTFAMRNYGIKGFSTWGSLPKNIDKHIDEMLAKNIPVTLSIGPNTLPFIRNHKLTLYTQKNSDYIPSCEINSHYVSVTQNLNDWYKISSWGRCYYINKNEYKEYIHKYSNWIVSNILIIKF